jgi:hypothetical protein
MTSDDFRRLAVSLPEAIESAHMNHPDFRVRGKIFATLGPGEAWGMVKVTPEQQEMLIRAAPAIFSPVKGAWGRRGCTVVRLETAERDILQAALVAAWRNTAPKRLAEKLDLLIPPTALGQ